MTASAKAVGRKARAPVRFLTCTTANQKSWQKSQAGRSRWYLAQDPCADVVNVCDVLPAQLEAVTRAHWQQGMLDMQAGQVSGLVWLHPDVSVDDFLAARRLQAYWSGFAPGDLPLGVARHAGEVVFRAMGACAETNRETDISEHLALSFQNRPLRCEHSAEPNPPLLVVTASREPPESFYSRTALGRSVRRLRIAGANIRVHAACNNHRPLGEVYNRAVTDRFAQHIVVFTHDDLHLNDHHLPRRLERALEKNDLVGVAGCTQRHPAQPTWFCAQRLGQWSPSEQLLGSVAHDTTQRPSASRQLRNVSHYGPAGQAKLLDGVLIAMRGQTWLDSQLRFDPALAFHFYDLDLCRSAEHKGLRMGVEPLAVTHLSGGAFRTPDWEKAYSDYLKKWGERLLECPT